MKSELSGTSGFVTVMWGEEATAAVGVRLIALKLKGMLEKVPAKRVTLGKSRKARLVAARPNNARMPTFGRYKMQTSIPVAGIFEPASTRTRPVRREALDEYEILRRKIYG